MVGWLIGGDVEGRGDFDAPAPGGSWEDDGVDIVGEDYGEEWKGGREVEERICVSNIGAACREERLREN